MVSHLSTMFCLTGFVCQLAFVRTRKKPIERMKEIWKGRPGELTCHQEETKERARGFTAAESFLLSIPLIFLCSPSHLHGRWEVSEVGKVKLLCFVDPQAQWTTAQINQFFSANGDQAPNLLLKGGVRLCGWCFCFIFLNQALITTCAAF